MDAAITNTTASPVFIPGPNIELAATGDPNGYDTKSWLNITLGALDSNEVIKAGMVSGDLTVAMTPDAEDAAQATQTGKVGLNDPNMHGPSYTVALLPATGNFEGQLAYATDGRKTGEGAGAGTGAPVYWSNANWHVYFDDTTVVA